MTLGSIHNRVFEILKGPMRIKGVYGQYDPGKANSEAVLLCCEKGAATVRVNEKVVCVIDEGDCVWVVPHEAASVAANWGEVLSLRISCDRVWSQSISAEGESPWTPIRILGAEGQETLKQLEKVIEDVWHYKPHSLSDRILESCSRLYITYLHDLLARVSDEPTPNSSGPGSRFLQAVGFIQDNKCTSLRKADIANAVDMSESGLTQLFYRFSGLCLSDMVFLYRSLLARQLLESSGESVKEVAAACGFGNSDYFIQAFRRWFNITPLQYRKQFRSSLHQSGALDLVSLHEVKDFELTTLLEPGFEFSPRNMDVEGKPISHLVFNRTKGTVIISWLEPQLGNVRSFSLDPGFSEMIHDWAGNRWHIQDAVRNTLACFEVGRENCITLLRQGPSSSNENRLILG